MKASGEIFNLLSYLQKRSVFKIAIELVKADKQIHKNEIAILDEFQLQFHLLQEDLDSIHYISLQDAIECLRGLPEEVLNVVLSVYDEIIRIDNDVDFGENILLSAIKLVLGSSSSSWTGIISVSGVDAEVSQSQIVYLEDEYTPAVHDVFDDENDFLLISKALGDIGFTLFNLTNVKEDLERRWGINERVDSKYDLLQHSVGYLVPSGDKEKINNLNPILRQLDAKSFYKIVLSRYGITPDRIPSKSFLLLKIRDCFVMDDEDTLRKTVDFLYIDISSDVKKRILSFVSVFDVTVFQLSYEGYYRILFDYLSTESKMMSHIELDTKFNFYLSDISNEQIKFESSPQSRSFYLLLLKYGQGGVEQSTFEQAINSLQHLNENKYITKKGLDLMSLETDLLRTKTDWSILIYNTIVIYSYVSTKDTGDASFLKYIINILQHRSSLKNYINNGFMAIPRLANKEQYCIAFNIVTKSYCVPISPSMFEIVDRSSGTSQKLSGSSFWKRLY